MPTDRTQRAFRDLAERLGCSPQAGSDVVEHVRNLLKEDGYGVDYAIQLIEQDGFRG